MSNRNLFQLAIIGLFFAGGGLAWWGFIQEQLFLSGGGIIMMGLVILVWGIQPVITRRDSQYEDDRHRTYTYSGLAAVLRGFGMITIALGFFVGGAVVMFGAFEQGQIFFRDYPGLVMSIGTGAGALFLLPDVIGSDQFQRRPAIIKMIGRVWRGVGVLLLLTLMLGGLLLTVNDVAFWGIFGVTPEQAQEVLGGIQPPQ